MGKAFSELLFRSRLFFTVMGSPADRFLHQCGARVKQKHRVKDLPAADVMCRTSRSTGSEIASNSVGDPVSLGSVQIPRRKQPNCRLISRTIESRSAFCLCGYMSVGWCIRLGDISLNGLSVSEQHHCCSMYCMRLTNVSAKRWLLPTVPLRQQYMRRCHAASNRDMDNKVRRTSYD